MFNIKELLCNHDYKYKGAYAEDDVIRIRYLPKDCIRVRLLYKCNKCGKLRHVYQATFYEDEELPKCLEDKIELLDKVERGNK